MAFNWNFKPRTRKGFYSAPVESLMPQAPGAIPTQMKGQVNLPEIEQPFDFNSYFTNLVNREEMDGYHPAQNFSVPNQQHGGNPAVNYDGYSPTTPMSEQDVINQNLAERQTGNADDMANWIQQGGTPQADAAAAAQAQAEQEAAAKTQRIAEIESEIKEIETRIATNTAKLQNFTGNADKIAAIEARKINAQDPTSIWRWKGSMDQQRINRQQDLERIEKEKKLTEAKNLKLNRNKIDNILQTTMPTQNMTRDKMDMAVKQLNDAEELAKNYGDTDALKKINERKNELGVYVPVDDEANIIESDFVKNMEMVGKKGGMSKKQFAQYVQSVLDDPKNKHIWHYSPELQRKLYTAIGKNTGAKPTNYAGY